ncbi:hypothetical protein MRX96_033859 [Rhipicephalus microplus]
MTPQRSSSHSSGFNFYNRAYFLGEASVGVRISKRTLGHLSPFEKIDVDDDTSGCVEAFQCAGRDKLLVVYPRSLSVLFFIVFLEFVCSLQLVFNVCLDAHSRPCVDVPRVPLLGLQLLLGTHVGVAQRDT